MTASLLMALLAIQAPQATAPVPDLSGQPRLAPGILIEEVAAVPVPRVGQADAWGCLDGASLCRHQAVLVEGAEFQPGRSGVFTVHRASLSTYYRPLNPQNAWIPLVGGRYLVPVAPDCDTYSDCLMWSLQAMQNEEISREMRVIARENRAREAASGKDQRTCNSAACAGSSSTAQGGSGGARFGAGRGGASGTGGFVGGGGSSVSTQGSGGTTYTSTTSSGGGGRTGSARER